MKLIYTDEKNFDNAINSKQKVLVDFYATWCGPCKMLGPVLEKASQSLDDNSLIIKVDIDENPSLAAKFNVNTIPTLIYFENGQVKNQSIGFMPEQKILEFFK